MNLTFAPAELVKFDLLASGIVVTQAAEQFIGEANKGRPMSSADYASTSGLILRLDGDVWVNAPTNEHNANFVDAAPYVLLADDGRLFVDGPHGRVGAHMWLQPDWHERTTTGGDPYRRVGVAHTDRVRVSPIEGCAYTCTFCDLPFEYRYRSKSVDALLETVAAALSDPDQSSGHVLISGGTPRPEDYDYVRECYESILAHFPGVPVDIMMVPLREILDLENLSSLGLQEISINIEIWSRDIARRVMPRKYKQGRDFYLDFLSEAAEILGGGNVRSMLMVGIEPLEETLAGVEAIAQRGCVPVLSPFRPDPATPLRDWPAPSAEFLKTAYSESWAITRHYDVALGPACMPCAHNTLTLPSGLGHGSADTSFGQPRLAG